MMASATIATLSPEACNTYNAAEATFVPMSILKETTSTSVPWFKASPTSCITPRIQSFFREFAGIEPADLEVHLLTIRERAWRTCPYPCVGAWGFLRSLMQMLPTYTTIASILREEGLFLDLGCCFAEEMRWLAVDGVPTERMIGVDLKREFWELGFELFRDKQSNNAKFIVGDVFDAMNEDLGALHGQVDVIFAGNFFHLFSREGQLQAMKQAVLLSRQPGSVICGVHVGTVETKALSSAWKRGPGKSEQFYHDAQSWQQLWNEVEEQTRTKWKVQVWSQRMVEENEKHVWMGQKATRFKFHCTREL